MKYFKDYLNIKLIRTMKRLDFKSPIFEVGCGTGETLMYLCKYYNICKGIDLSDHAIAICKSKGLAASTINLSDITEKFNSVICIDVLEHIEDDAAFVGHLYKILNNDGKLLILVPSGKILGDDLLFGHYRRYSKHSIKRLLEENNFIIESSEMFGYPVLYYTRLIMNYLYKPKACKNAVPAIQTVKSSYEHPFDNTIFASLVNNRIISALVLNILRFENFFVNGNKGFAIIVAARKR